MLGPQLDRAIGKVQVPALGRAPPARNPRPLRAAARGSAAAAAPSPANQARLDSTVRFLQEAQNADGGFGGGRAEPSQSISAWVALALAAAGINPRDQAQPGGTDAFSFLVTHFRQGSKKRLRWPIDPARPRSSAN